ncbi:MAG: malonyl-CoA synthase, partial [Paracoccaceae bacterium]
MPNPLFDALLARHRDSAETLVIRPDGLSLSYGSFFEAVARTAAVLRNCGLGPGDRLALQVEKSVEA